MRIAITGGTGLVGGHLAVTLARAGRGVRARHCDHRSNARRCGRVVLDVPRYRQADHKIGRLHRLVRNRDSGVVKHGGRFLGVPAPAVIRSFDVTAHSRVDFVGLRMPLPLRGFTGHFTCAETVGGTRVTHRECFQLGWFIGPVVKAVFGGWFARDTAAEVPRMKTILEGERSR